MPERNQLKLELPWQYSPKSHELPRNLSHWLLDPGSFMKRLRSQGAENPRVQLLRQIWQFPALSEKRALGTMTRDYALIREVLIYSEGKKWMYARTVFPRKTLTGKQQCLARLKNRSLGSVLFNDPTIERGPFEMICLTQAMPFHQYVLEQTRLSVDQLWARRSRFVLHDKPLLLTEVFLPDVEKL
ncbi:MAG TPA: chorismate lyase [Gammaproteobacteria bacterium]|nr:chorismate lyase [Gammaproteobacteria bacterium]